MCAFISVDKARGTGRYALLKALIKLGVFEGVRLYKL